MEFLLTGVYNFENAFRGMRNPLNSWNKSDSYFGIVNCNYYGEGVNEVTHFWIEKELQDNNLKYDYDSKEYGDMWVKYDEWLCENCFLTWDNDMAVYAALGPNDLQLAQKLIKSGPEHAKFMRQIFVSVDITAPLYWWKEFDTYKIGTTANSTSTMHKLMSKPFTFDMFSFDLENEDIEVSKTKIDETNGELVHLILTLEDFYFDVIENCNILRQKYLETKDIAYWRALVQILPNAFNQTRTWTANYAVLRTMYFQRRNHKLKEWHEFCDWIATLPYSEELIMLED